MAEMRMTFPVIQVLVAMLSSADQRTYGYDLMRQTGTSSGTLYPILARLEANKLVTSDWEDAKPDEVGRGKRRYYILTPDGYTRAELERKNLQKIYVQGGLSYV